MEPISICYYHSPCQDGSAGCYVVSLFNSNVESFGVPPGHPINCEKFDKGKTISQSVCFVDVCPPEDNIKEFATLFKRVYIFDHHDKTKNYNFDSCSNVHFVHDMQKSGCQIAFDYLNDNSANKLDRPWYLDYIADRDLWQHKLPHTHEINSGMLSEFMNSRCNIKLFFDRIKSPCTFNQLLEIGKKNIAVDRQQIETSVSQAREYRFKYQGLDLKCWKYDCKSTLRSDVGNILSVKTMSDGSHPDFSVFWQLAPSEKEWWVSLRGSDKSPNLSELAGMFSFMNGDIKVTGGGHAKAAGFTIRSKETGPDDEINFPEQIFTLLY